MCIFGDKPTRMLDLPGPKGWKPRQVPSLDDISFGVIGWREWRYQGGGPTTVLYGSFGKTWLPDKSMGLIAGYGKKDRGKTVLSKYGDEGVYARKSEEAVRVQYRGYLWGEVLLWGSVAEYAGGYRAQYAYPLSFFTDRGGTAEYLKRWAQYGVYVNIYSPETEGADEQGYIEYA